MIDSFATLFRIVEANLESSVNELASRPIATSFPSTKFLGYESRIVLIALATIFQREESFLVD